MATSQIYRSVRATRRSRRCKWPKPSGSLPTAAWFTGYLPADQPRFAFAALYEGEVGSTVHGGSAAAPMVADIFKEIYKGQQANGRKKSRAREETEVRRAEPVEEEDESD